MRATKALGEPPRETISLLLTSILGGVGLVEAIVLLEETIGASTEIPVTSIIFFVVYLSFWMRFIPGNVSHIRILERWPTNSVNIWLWDLAFITTESLLLVYMAKPSVKDPTQFFAALLILLFLDIIWLVSMIPHAGKQRPKPNYVWLYLNAPSAFLIALSLITAVWAPKYAGIFGPTSDFGTCIIPSVFFVIAVIDIYFSAPDWFGRPRVKELRKEELKNHKKWMKKAIEEADTSLKEGGIPIGAVLVQDETIIGSGHNRRVQDNNPTAHAEIDCLKNAGRKERYTDMTFYSTLMPCTMCAGSIFLFGIRKVVVGESRNFAGARACLEGWGVHVIDLDMEECYDMLKLYKEKNRHIWEEDIGYR